jgi:hypothetical protein
VADRQFARFAAGHHAFGQRRCLFPGQTTRLPVLLGDHGAGPAASFSSGNLAGGDDGRWILVEDYESSLNVPPNMSELPNVGGHWLLGPGRSAVE